MKTIKLTDYELFLLQNSLHYYENFVSKSQINSSTQDSLEKLQNKVNLIVRVKSSNALCGI